MYLSVGRRGLYLKDYDISEIKDHCKQLSFTNLDILTFLLLHNDFAKNNLSA